MIQLGKFYHCLPALERKIITNAEKMTKWRLKLNKKVKPNSFAEKAHLTIKYHSMPDLQFYKKEIYKFCQFLTGKTGDQLYRDTSSLQARMVFILVCFN